MEYEDHSSEDFIRSKTRKHTTAGTKFAPSDKQHIHQTDSNEGTISAIYSRLEGTAEEDIHHEGDDEDEGEDHELIKENCQKSSSPTSTKLCKRKDSLVFNHSKSPKGLRVSRNQPNKPQFTHSNIVDLEDEEEEEEESAVPILICNKTVKPFLESKLTGNNMVGESDIALNGDSVERQELTALETQPKKSILRPPLEHATSIHDTEDSPVAYITRLDKDGNIEQVPDTLEDEVSEVNPMADFMSADILTKPFNFVAGSATKSRFNPFRKKSGLLNVLARQSTKNRIVAKNGTLNTINEYHSTKFWKDIFITMIDLNWGWIFLVFASAFFSSWLGFAIIWYLTFLQHGDLAEENFLDGEVGGTPAANFTPCASAITGFTSSFLFSLETQHTIGYGGR